ncbi:hypothetical protein ABTF26_22090, partial [Acinetobacter baumannii]
RFGQDDWRVDTLCAVTVLGLLAWFVLATPPSILLAVPFLFVCTISGVVGSKDRRERLRKAGLFVAAVVLLLCGPIF